MRTMIFECDVFVRVCPHAYGRPYALPTHVAGHCASVSWFGVMLISMCCSDILHPLVSFVMAAIVRFVCCHMGCHLVDATQ
jgi:hypothetical protein